MHSRANQFELIELRLQHSRDACLQHKNVIQHHRQPAKFQALGEILPASALQLLQ
jgi:hypothetical protein